MAGRKPSRNTSRASGAAWLTRSTTAAGLKSKYFDGSLLDEPLPFENGWTKGKFLPASRAYLDHNATTPLRPAARAAMIMAFDLAGNASSVHAEGRAARNVIETSRGDIAAFVGTAAKNVVFVSGATEALNLALTPSFTAAEAGCDVLLVAAGEHSCVRDGHRFPEGAVEILPLTATGVLDLVGLEAALDRHAGRRVMLALQAANNETGALQPVAKAAKLVHAAGGFVICDVVQAVGRVECGFAALNADVLALSAHKIGGPKGVGALCFASDAYHIKDRLLRGGAQERGWRAGTENIPAVAGFAAAIRALAATSEAEVRSFAMWRDELEAIVRRVAPHAVFFGTEAPRLANTSCFAVPGIEAQLLLMLLDVEGVAVSSGSACSSGKVKPSHVLAAMGVGPELAKGALRLSLGWNSQVGDIEVFSRAFEKAIRTIGTKAGQTGGLSSQGVKSAA
jgi:cysteine desulfurase